jgi:hypothetical protein
MSTGAAKPRPTDQEALFLILMRRDRAKEVMNEILHRISPSGITMPTPALMLDYLTNMLMSIEMALKLLSNDWGTHNVGKMFETITGKPHDDPALMEAVKTAIMDQKYLLSPAVGIVDHIPELEELYDFPYLIIRSKYACAVERRGSSVGANPARHLSRSSRKQSERRWRQRNRRSLRWKGSPWRLREQVGRNASER